MITKKCCRCRETKPADCFNKNAARADGLQDQCRACRSVINAGIRFKQRHKAIIDKGEAALMRWRLWEFRQQTPVRTSLAQPADRVG